MTLKRSVAELARWWRQMLPSITPDASQDMGRRLLAVSVLWIFGFTILTGRLIYYQVARHTELKAEAISQRLWEKTLPPRRGDILDTNGHPLAITMENGQWDIAASPILIFYPEELADILAEMLDMQVDEVYNLLTSSEPWVLLAHSVPQDIGMTIVDLQAQGIICEPHHLRVYPEGELTAPLLGIVNETGDGFYGVEGFYNPQLVGTAGKRTVEQNPLGEELPIRPEDEIVSQPGQTIVLTLDRKIQEIAKYELERGLRQFGAESGTIIVMKPGTGALLSVASYPTYDPNERLSLDTGLLVDPSISEAWEPGSLFRIATWAAGLDSGTFGPETTYYDEGALEVGGQLIQNWDRQDHGLVTMSEGFAKSLNTYAAHISTSVGRETFYIYLQRFGFGDLTGVDLASEGIGMLKLPSDPDWIPSDLGTISFGQGLAVTPLQMVTAVAVIANSGLLMRPHIVRELSPENYSETGQALAVEPIVRRRVISEETAHTLTSYLVKTVEQEVTEAQVPGYQIAGLSGTAHIPTADGHYSTDTVASFVGYVPAQDPQFIILVKLDKPTVSPWGATTAAPIFRAIAEKLIVYMQIPPDDVP